MWNQLMNFIAGQNPFWAYGALFGAAFIENVFPPAPADAVVVFGAYLIVAGNLNPVGVFVSTTLGSWLGFLSMYYLAFWLERSVLEMRYLKWIEKESVQKVEKWFQQYGYRLILFNRFLAGLRSVISLVAGFSKLEFKRVALLSGISAAVWNGILIFAGYSLGENWENIYRYLKTYGYFSIILIVFSWLVWYFLRKTKEGKKRND